MQAYERFSQQNERRKFLGFFSALLLFMFFVFCFFLKEKKTEMLFFLQKHFESFSLKTDMHVHQQLPSTLYDRAALN